MVKKRISATIEEGTDNLIDELSEMRVFRNRSHAIEEAVKIIYELMNREDKSRKGALDALKSLGI